MKILLVDDEAIALQTMENIIRQSDFKSHTILTATNAADAWVSFRQSILIFCSRTFKCPVKMESIFFRKYLNHN